MERRIADIVCVPPTTVVKTVIVCVIVENTVVVVRITLEEKYVEKDTVVVLKNERVEAYSITVVVDTISVNVPNRVTVVETVSTGVS